jgi:glycosyltransferase involved in cell wall biosynthesis
MKTYGIDANVLTRQNITGTERYVSALLKEMMKTPLLDDERVLLYVSAPVKALTNLPKGWEVKVLAWPKIKGWTHLRLSMELIINTPDVFFSPAHEIPLFAPRTQIVATVHDVAFRALPNLYSPKAIKRQDWSVRRQIRMASKLLSVSESTKDDLLKYYQVEPSMVVPTLLAVDEEMFKISESSVNETLVTYSLESKSYFLSIGRIEKKKNIGFLISAFEEYRKEHKGVLVLGGSFGFGGDEIKDQIENSPFRSDIRALGYVPDDDLPALMRGARAYVFPTNYEGFGIPALEAMAADIPLIASDIPALREVAGDAALFADPSDVQAWATAMAEVSLETEVLREKGKERLGHFSWTTTAAKTWEVLRSL